MTSSVRICSATGPADDATGVGIHHRGAVQLPFCRGVFGVGSDRSALPVFRPVGFCGPPSEPGVPITEHRALHVIMPMGRPRFRAANSPTVWGSSCPGIGIDRPRPIVAGTSPHGRR